MVVVLAPREPYTRRVAEHARARGRPLSFRTLRSHARMRCHANAETNRYTNATMMSARITALTAKPIHSWRSGLASLGAVGLADISIRARLHQAYRTSPGDVDALVIGKTPPRRDNARDAECGRHGSIRS